MYEQQRKWRDIGPLMVYRPALDRHGERLLFDIRLTDPATGRGSPYYLALYDIAAEEVRLLLPPPPRSLYSGSFAPDNNRVVLVQHCGDPQLCQPEEQGNQIGFLDLKKDSFELVTDARDPVPMNYVHQRDRVVWKDGKIAGRKNPILRARAERVE